LWDWVIRTRRVLHMLPVLESVLAGFGAQAPGEGEETERLEPAFPGEGFVNRNA
jgi:hypothetical protein